MNMVKSIPTFPVKNIAKAAEFYTTKLGFTVKHQEATFAIVIRNNVEIHLWQSCDKSWISDDLIKHNVQFAQRIQLEVVKRNRV